ncbi:unnamed protein product [Somion occarium]|uniref:Uncharacterized protein n=1 Tax=Somion occarium TaxID=3059160 RepID=A0ABP1DQ14_9APHY
MSKRKRVPVAVHSELTEYSALLRALRTTDTLDLTSHVIPENVLRRFHTERDSQNLNDDVDSTNVDTNILPSPSRAPSAGLQSDAMSVDVSPSSSRRPSHKEITWTRWPLLVGDVHIPEFSFEDEVRNMAKQILELKMRASLRQGLPEGHVLASEATQTNTVSDDDSPKDASPPASPSSASTTLDASESLPHHVLNPLCQATATHLSQILGSVASMVPDVHISMQDRLKPVDWQDLLGMVGECGFVDQSIIQRVRDRMLALYPEDEAYVEGSLHNLEFGDIAARHQNRCLSQVSDRDFAFLQPDWYDPKAVGVANRKRTAKKKEVGGSQTPRSRHSRTDVGDGGIRADDSSSDSAPLAG